ncbi:MAG TPA: hypothetical protein VL984_04670, partial [Acidimicrobiales bacterium]|nr:hypothetical protein [Acidimicrobiales bacterium]
PSLSAPTHSLTTLSYSKCVMVTPPLVNGPPGGSPAHVPSRVRPAERGPHYEGVAGDDELVDTQVQVRERLMVAADDLAPG